MYACMIMHVTTACAYFCLWLNLPLIGGQQIINSFGNVLRYHDYNRFLSFFFSEEHGISLYMSPFHGHVLEGADMNFICELVGLTFPDNDIYPGYLIISRSFVISFRIYINPFVSRGFHTSEKLPDRYKISRHINKFYINITDVRLSDAGWWTCLSYVNFYERRKGSAVFVDVIGK